MHRQRRRGLSWARLFRLNLVDKSVGSWLKLQVATKTISMAVKQTTYICQTCPYSISTGQVSKSQRATVSSRCRLTNKPASTPKMIPKMTSEQLWLLNILANQRLWLSGASRSCFHAQARLLSPGHEAGKSSLHGSGRRQDRWLWPREGGQITASVHRICLDSVVSCTRSPTSVNDVLSADWYLGSRVHHGRVVHIQTPVSGQLGDWRNLQDLFRARDSGQTRLAGIVSPRRRHELQVPAVFTDPVEQDHHERVSRSELRFRSLDKPNDSK